jgi:hypothetical protein
MLHRYHSCSWHQNPAEQPFPATHRSTHCHYPPSKQGRSSSLLTFVYRTKERDGKGLLEKRRGLSRPAVTGDDRLKIFSIYQQMELLKAWSWAGPAREGCMDSLITVQIKITLLLLSFPEKLFRTPIRTSTLAYTSLLSVTADGRKSCGMLGGG